MNSTGSGVLSDAFLDQRMQGKNMFKLGKVTESFDFLEEMLDQARKRVAKGSESALFEVMESLIVLARLRMEVGQFTKVDWCLTETRAILTSNNESLKRLSEDRVLFLWGKYYHLQGKNFWRELYHQRSYEVFNEGIDFLKNYKSPNERL